MRKLKEKSIRFATELHATGATGLGERKQELQAEVDGAYAVAARFEHQTKTVELLTEAEKAANEAFLHSVGDRRLRR